MEHPSFKVILIKIYNNFLNLKQIKIIIIDKITILFYLQYPKNYNNYKKHTLFAMVIFLSHFLK